MESQFDIRGFIENSLLEWENHLAAVVIAGGCNLRCPYCHSWRYVTGLDDLEEIQLESVLALLKRQRGWLDGVVITGGEPTLQPGLEWMVRKIGEFGLPVKLHSNGTRPEVIGRLLENGLLACLALDYKAPLDNRYFEASGIQPREQVLDKIRESFRLAAASGIEREYHTTLNPRFVTPEVLVEMGRELESGGAWFLQQFEHKDCLDAAKAGRKHYTSEELDELAGVAGKTHAPVLLKKGTTGA